MNKTLRIILIGFFICTFIGNIILWVYFDSMRSSYNQGMSIRGADVVFFVADGFSESDLLGVKEFLDQWHGKVTIAGLSEEQTTSEGSLVTGILISDIDEITLYDAIVIPGGESALALNVNQDVASLLHDADDQGLVVAGIGIGTLVQAKAGLITGKKFTCDSSIVTNLTAAGGFYVNGAAVVTDGTIITAFPPNYEEISYAIANALGYSYTLVVDISFEKEDDGWNYSLVLNPSDKHIVDSIDINLSKKETTGEKTLINSYNLMKEKNGGFSINLGILANGYYIVDIKSVSIYGKIEVRTNVKEFSVGSN
ncbi:MAG: DJ-1/PfpI family protein [Promethearchaeota archaeon]